MLTFTTATGSKYVFFSENGKLTLKKDSFKAIVKNLTIGKELHIVCKIDDTHDKVITTTPIISCE